MEGSKKGTLPTAHGITLSKVYLKQKLYMLSMQEGSDFVEHMNAFNQVVTDLARLSVKIDDEDRAILLLCSLPPSMSIWSLH